MQCDNTRLAYMNFHVAESTADFFPTSVEHAYKLQVPQMYRNAGSKSNLDPYGTSNLFLWRSL